MAITKALIAVLLVALMSSQARAWNECMLFYRSDVTEIWSVPADSSLCTIDKSRTEDPNQYGITIKEGQLTLTSLDFEVSLRDCPITEKNTDFDFSVSVNRDDLPFPHFFTFAFTDDQSKAGTFSDHCFETWDKAECRTTFYLERDALNKPTSRYLGFKIYVMAVEACVGVAAIFAPSLAVVFNTVFLFSTAFFMQQSGFVELRLFVAMAALIVLAGLFVVCLLAACDRRCYLNLLGIFVVIAFLRVNTFLEAFWCGVIAVTALGIGWLLFEDLVLVEKSYFEVGFSLAWLQQYQFWSTSQAVTLPEFVARLFFYGDLRRGTSGREEGFSLSACLWAAGVLAACFVSAWYWSFRLAKMRAAKKYEPMSPDLNSSRFD